MAAAAYRGERGELCPGVVRFIADVERQAEGAAHDGSFAAQRAAYDAFSARFRTPRPAGIEVRDVVMSAGTRRVPVRVYRPTASTRQTAEREPAEREPAAAAIIYMHGGGWVLGSVDTHDSVTADLAVATGALVVSVDYRLAPEAPFPAAFEDCYAVLEAVGRDSDALGVDPDRIAVAGDSAGGTLAAAVAMAARDRGGPGIACQAHIYPVLTSALDLPSYEENATAPMLTTADMAHYWRLYLGHDGPSSDPIASPLAASDYAGLPPAIVLTAGHDPVRDDGTVYANRLLAAGVPVIHHCAADLPHGHLRARDMSPSAAQEFVALGTALRVLLRLA